MRCLLTLLFLLLFFAPQANAMPKEDFEVFLGSISSHKVNVRAGPGTNFPILWVYKMQGYPVKVINHYGTWYNVKDVEGEEGWVHQNFISRRQTALVRASKPAPLFKDRDGQKPLLLLQDGVIVVLKRCALGLCEVEVSGKDGWIDAKHIKKP